MTARMYYDPDAESSGQWPRGARPWTSERECQDAVEGGTTAGEGIRP